MTTPMMVQWHACKAQAKGALLLFRLGDFYEAFEDDAVVLSKELDIVLTKRQETPMAGIPAHSADAYLDRLVSKGYRVAVAEQMEDPSQVKGQVKGIVKREVVRLLTPGSVIQSALLQDKVSNFMAAVVQVNSIFGLAVLDVTTADFRVMEFTDGSQLIDELARLNPQEVIISEKASKKLSLEALSIAALQVKEEWEFDHQSSLEKLIRHFGVHSLDGFGLKGMTACINAAGGLLSYATEDLNLKLPHLKKISPFQTHQFLWLDRTTQKHLELVEPLHEKGLTLLSVLDTTVTPMGGRLLKEWLVHPLLSVKEIESRQTEVQHYFEDDKKRVALREALKNVRDLERLIMRIETGYTSPRDLVGLRYSLEPIPLIFPEEDLSSIHELIKKAVVDHPPLKLSEGGIFKEGYDQELDEIKKLKTDSQTWLASYQAQLRETLQIKTLKVGYTQAFGYYIDVSRGQSDKMPLNFQRRQTLVNAERFISPELKEFEHKIYSAEEKIGFLETKLFQELRAEITKSAEHIRRVAKKLAHLDVILSFADSARKQNYIRPLVTEKDRIEILAGRHPVIEASIEKQTFVPNDIVMDGDKEQLLVITGPNMAGKSTFIRQAALLVLMAQMGCFIPAKKAEIGVVDKIFTRIGASDDLSRGQSTFMVEMSETANILHNATSKSLVILDEIGRGTSTYDGIAIAWSVADFFLTTSGKRAKTLFATHYFELTELEKEMEGAVNYNVAVEESEKGIVFLHRIVRGGADKSYGIHVAKLAGLPSSVLKKAHEMLTKLHHNAPDINMQKESQLELF
ncbi:MAG: DNA mismatch repair protein MutS [Rhabdochlamydiaceae bacterium]|nr:DNA mismatch repair protein MutS [Rhabdochlamydiaceae bacterium]